MERLPSDPTDAYITIKNNKYKIKTPAIVLGLSHEKHRKRLTWHFRKGKWMRPLERDVVGGNAMMAAEILIYK